MGAAPMCSTRPRTYDVIRHEGPWDGRFIILFLRPCACTRNRALDAARTSCSSPYFRVVHLPLNFQERTFKGNGFMVQCGSFKTRTTTLTAHSALELVIDSTLDSDAAVPLHEHSARTTVLSQPPIYNGEGRLEQKEYLARTGMRLLKDYEPR